MKLNIIIDSFSFRITRTGVIWYRNAPERRSGSFFGDPQTPIIGSRSRARHGLGAFRFFFVYEIIPAFMSYG